jgi:hypothetical protein
MKSSDRIIIGFLALCVVAFAIGIAWKVSHRAPRPAATETTAAAPSKPSAAPASPAASDHGGTPPQMGNKDLMKAGLLNPIFYIQGKLRTMAQSITAAMNRRVITLDDLEKLDFTPGSEDEYGVFNPKGKIAFVPGDGRWIDQSMLDAVTTKKGTPLVYNLRRTTDAKGQVTDVLYAIIPNAAPSACGIGAGAKDLNANEAIVLEKDNHQLVEDIAGTPVINVGCVHAPDGNTAWFFKVRLRSKRPNDVRWGSHG